MKFTPGPWMICPNTKSKLKIINKSPFGGIIAEASNWWADTETAKANAQLISSAPDLLDALYSILNVEGAARIGSESGALKGLDWKYHFDKVRNAITKAEC